MQSLLHDLRYGFRMLRQNPAFTAAAVLILGLGIGANTVIFSIVDRLVFRPLPYQDSERLVLVMEGNDQLKFWGPVSFPNFLDWRTQNHLMDRMASFTRGMVNFWDGGEPVRIKSIRCTADLFPLLGLPLQQGRSFHREDCAPGHGSVVILSHGLWQRRFGSSAQALGGTVVVDGRPHTVIGVTAPGVKMGYLIGFEPELYLPLVPPEMAGRGSRYLGVIARLKPGATEDQAQAELSVIARRLEQQYPDTNHGWKVLVSGIRGKVDPVAYVLLAILVISVLGVACTNVANLLLARAAGREKEISIRAALGAGRWRLMRQLLTESLLLAFIGSCLGTLGAFWTCSLIRASSAGSNMEVVDIRPDLRVLAATAVFFVVAGVAVGLAPGLRFSSFNLNRTLKAGHLGSSSASTNRLGSILVGSQIMLSLILLVGGTAAIKSWFKLWQVEPGFRRENVVVLSLSLTEARYSDAGRQMAFFQELLSRLQSRQEIVSAGIVSALPTMGPQISFTIPDRPGFRPGTEPLARYTAASPGYLKTLAIPVRSGRAFTEADNATTLPVALINETMARRHWNQENPLGTSIDVKGCRRIVVGVIGDLRNVPLAVKPMPEIYVPFVQSPESHALLAVQTTSTDSLGIAPVLKQEVQAIDPHQPADRPETLKKVLGQDMGVITLGSRVLVALGLGALLLAGAGLYGVLSYFVARRSHEFGIRMALGARQSDVLRLVLRQAGRLSLFGVLPGLALSVLLVRVLSRSLFGVSAVEPFILVGLSLLLTVVALLAGYVPARRATRVDPMVALRCE